MIGSTASEVDAAITGWGIQQKQKQSKQTRIPIFRFLIAIPPRET
jgi:hypothetical protein